jgi:hypothetical protein
MLALIGGRAAAGIHLVFGEASTGVPPDVSLGWSLVDRFALPSWHGLLAYGLDQGHRRRPLVATI